MIGEPVLVDDDKVSSEKIEELAQLVATFNYDYQQIDQHSTWSAWHIRKMDTTAALRKLSFLDKLAILYRVADLHDARAEKYLQYGISKNWDEDKEFQKNVLAFLGDGMEEARVLR